MGKAAPIRISLSNVLNKDAKTVFVSAPSSTLHIVIKMPDTAYPFGEKKNEQHVIVPRLTDAVSPQCTWLVDPIPNLFAPVFKFTHFCTHKPFVNQALCQLPETFTVLSTRV